MDTIKISQKNKWEEELEECFFLSWQPFQKDLQQAHCLFQRELPENDRLEAVGYMIDKLLEMYLLLSEKQFIACFKPMFELCMVSKTFQDEEVTYLCFNLFGTLMT